MSLPRQSIPTATATPSLPSVASSALSQTSSSVTGSDSGPTRSVTNVLTTTTTTTTTSSSTSSSAATTSTPQTTSDSSSPVPTSVTTQTSQTSASSSSSALPPTASSTHSSFSSSNTTQPPIPSSSQQPAQTTITSAYTTYVNGSLVLTQTAFPSTIPQLSSPSSSQRTAIIAGSAAGGTALLILLLSLAFCARRKQFKRLDFLQAISLRRKQELSRATLLDGEDLDDLDLAHPPRRYTEYDTPWDSSQRALIGGRRTPATSAPSRLSETSSAFKEDVWPPPMVHEGTQLIDPLGCGDDPDLDLGRIVDDVMGPSSAVRFSDQSVSSVHRGSVVESEGVVHSRTVSNASNAGLLEAAGLSASTAPARSSPLAQPGTKPGTGSVGQ